MGILKPQSDMFSKVEKFRKHNEPIKTDLALMDSFKKTISEMVSMNNKLGASENEMFSLETDFAKLQAKMSSAYKEADKLINKADSLYTEASSLLDDVEAKFKELGLNTSDITGLNEFIGEAEAIDGNVSSLNTKISQFKKYANI